MAENQDALAGSNEQGAATTEAALSGGEQGTSHWSESFPEEYRESLKGFETPDAFKAALVRPEIPETYAVPEGVNVDQQTFEAFAPVAKELGLPQAAVEKLLAFDAERMKTMPERFVAAQDAANREELKTMASSLGAEKYNEAIAAANLALSTFASKEDIEWLTKAGLANSPRLVKLLANIGANLREDTPVGGEQSGGKKERSASVLYDNTPS